MRWKTSAQNYTEAPRVSYPVIQTVTLLHFWPYLHPKTGPYTFHIYIHHVTDTCQTIIWLLSLVDWPRVVTDIKSPPCSSKAVSSLSPKRKSTYPSPPDNTKSMHSVTVFSGLDLAGWPLGLVDLLAGAGWETLFIEPGTATKNFTESRWPWKDNWALTWNKKFILKRGKCASHALDIKIWNKRAKGHPL